MSLADIAAIIFPVIVLLSFIAFVVTETSHDRMMARRERARVRRHAEYAKRRAIAENAHRAEMARIASTF